MVQYLRVPVDTYVCTHVRYVCTHVRYVCGLQHDILSYHGCFFKKCFVAGVYADIFCLLPLVSPLLDTTLHFRPIVLVFFRWGQWHLGIVPQQYFGLACWTIPVAHSGSCSDLCETALIASLLLILFIVFVLSCAVEWKWLGFCGRSSDDDQLNSSFRNGSMRPPNIFLSGSICHRPLETRRKLVYVVTHYLKRKIAIVRSHSAIKALYWQFIGSMSGHALTEFFSALLNRRRQRKKRYLGYNGSCFFFNVTRRRWGVEKTM